MLIFLILDNTMKAKQPNEFNDENYKYSQSKSWKNTYLKKN